MQSADFNPESNLGFSSDVNISVTLTVKSNHSIMISVVYMDGKAVLYKIQHGLRYVAWDRSGKLPPLPEVMEGVHTVVLELQGSADSKGIKAMYSFHKVVGFTFIFI